MGYGFSGVMGGEGSSGIQMSKIPAGRMVFLDLSGEKGHFLHSVVNVSNYDADISDCRIQS